MISLLFCFLFATICCFNAEKEFASHIDAKKIRDNLKFYTSRAHPAGSKADYHQAIWTRDKFKSFGLETEIMTYYPLITFPLSRSLVLTSPTTYKAKLREDVIKGDRSSKVQDAVPTFLGYSADGDIKDAEIVYANFCDPSDFKSLTENNISVRGKIVLCRYGGAFRGLKVRAAELAGAAAVLIYSDPKEDGFTRGKVYPSGPYRPKSSVQRGSVQYSNFYSGDPLTPFVAATKDAPRMNVSDANIPKIPALPISHEDAEPFLKALVGYGVKASSISEAWQGGLPIQYWTGPAGRANLYLKHDFSVKPIWNVMATIPGKLEADRAILFGNHRDAWVFGAVDPNSGTAIMLETARIFGKMVKKGWKPDRTLIFASWDGEEYGLLGSTEFVEDRVAVLNKTLVAYINIDQGAYGKEFLASATPSLQTLIRQVTKSVVDPDSGKILYDIWKTQGDSDGTGEISELGFGSDYVPFIHQVGVASMDIRFAGPYGVYHSNYDSFNWMERFGDPGFKYSKVLCEITGKILLNLINSDVLPFDYSIYGEALEKYLVGVEKNLRSHSLNYSVTAIRDSIEAFKVAIPKITKQFNIQRQTQDIMGVKYLNDQLAFAERYFLDFDGISGRPWYRHVIYAPGEWTGYGAETMPGIHEAISRNERQSIPLAIQQVADSINRVVMFWRTRLENQ